MAKSVGTAARDSLTTPVVRIPCSGAVHGVQVVRGSLVFHDHDYHDIQAELALAAMGGSQFSFSWLSGCAVLLYLWRKRQYRWGLSSGVRFRQSCASSDANNLDDRPITDDSRLRDVSKQRAEATLRAVLGRCDDIMINLGNPGEGKIYGYWLRYGWTGRIYNLFLSVPYDWWRVYVLCRGVARKVRGRYFILSLLYVNPRRDAAFVLAMDRAHGRFSARSAIIRRQGGEWRLRWLRRNPRILHTSAWATAQD